MAEFQERPGSFTLSKNDKKTKDSQPDYRGKGLNLDGTPMWISGWIKKGNYGSFLSISIQPREEKSKDGTNDTPDNDDIPF